MLVGDIGTAWDGKPITRVREVVRLLGSESVDFGTGTRGFSAAEDLGLAVCVMPGTELAFAREVTCLPTGLLGWKTTNISHRTAIFRQVNKDKSAAHHDALEFPDGRTVLLRLLGGGQAATVLQLPAQPATAAEADAQKRVTYVG